MDIGMFSNDVKVPNKEKYYFVDKFDEFFQINNQTEFQDKIYRNSVNIQNNLEVFKKVLMEISELNQKDTTMLLHCLKFVDMLNLFMNKNILNKVCELIKEINDQIAVLTNLESKEDILKCIKYTEKSLIYYKKKHFKLLFFKDNDTIYKEFDELFSNTSEARNFKQLQNCFYIFSKKLDDEKRNNIQNKINQIKEKKSKSQNSINFYYNNNNNFGYNAYYNSYGSFYSNNYSYNNYYSKNRFINQDEKIVIKEKEDIKIEEVISTSVENNDNIIPETPSQTGQNLNKEECLEKIEVKSPSKNNNLKENDNFNPNYFKQNNGYFKKYYNNNYNNSYNNRNYYNYNNNQILNNIYSHENKDENLDKENHKIYDTNYKTFSNNEFFSYVQDLNTNHKTEEISSSPEQTRKAENTNYDTLHKFEENNEPTFNKHQIEIIPANVNYTKNYSNRDKSDLNINEHKYHHYSNSYNNNTYNFYNNNQNNTRNKYYNNNYNNKINNQYNYHSINNINEHSYNSRHNHNYHSSNNEHIYNKVNHQNNFQNISNNYKYSNHNQFNKYIPNTKNNHENMNSQVLNLKDSENHINIKNKQNLRKKERHNQIVTSHKSSEENITNNNVISTSPTREFNEQKQVSIEKTTNYQPFNFSENNNNILHLSVNQIFDLDKNEKCLAKNEEDNDKNDKDEIDDNEPEDFLNESIDSQNLDQMEQKINEYLKNNPDINNAIKNGPSEEDELEDNVSSSSQEQEEETDGNRSSNALPKNNKIIFADDNTDIIINTVPQNNKIYENHIDNKFTNDDVDDLIKKIINNDKNYETTEKIKINLDSEVFESKRFKENKGTNDNNTEDPNNFFYQENQIMSSPYNFNVQNHDLSNYHDYFMSNYAHFFFRGRDSSIHREYFALKCLEQQKPFLISTHLKDFEDKILIPLYQRINISMHKKKKLYYYTYTKYRNIIYKVLYNDKVLSKVEPYGSYVNNFLIDSGDIDICIVPKCSLIEFNIYLERIKDFIIEKVFLD